MTGVTDVKLMFCMLTVFGSRKFFVLETWEWLWHTDTNVKLFYMWQLTVESARSSLFWRPESESHLDTDVKRMLCGSWQFIVLETWEWSWHLDTDVKLICVCVCDSWHHDTAVKLMLCVTADSSLF